jgi:hypothetical protein
MGTSGSNREGRWVIPALDSNKSIIETVIPPTTAQKTWWLYARSANAPETARIDLGRPRGTHVNRRTPFATTGNAKETVACAVGIVESPHPLPTVGTLGTTLSPPLIFPSFPRGQLLP